jgi:hypothetical protein
VTVSTLSVVPEASASGTAPYAEHTHTAVPPWYARSTDIRLQAVARAARPDYPAWLSHVKAAAACTRPVRLAGTMTTVDTATGRILSERHTVDLPDGVIYKPCGNRRESVCSSCSQRYKRDAYQVVRAGLVGGKGVPEQVAHHPAVFPTLTAPSFGAVHTRVVNRHTCSRRTDCDCRPEPCHARRDLTVCPHGVRLACYARHERTDPRLGVPLCLDCYDYPGHAVWNLMAGELWRRTTIAVNRYMRRLARERGLADVPVPYTSNGKARVRWVPPFRLSFGKAAEMQRRAAVHYHAIIRLDGFDPDQPGAIVPPPPELDAADLVAALDHAAATVAFTTEEHPAMPGGWPIGWGTQNLTKVITVAAEGDVTDAQVAAYLAKYATKSTEITGHTSNRLTEDTIAVFADPDGTHPERLVEACWMLGRPRDWRRLRRWAHMLGFGGHFLTKSRRYSITFALLRDQRIVFRRTHTSGPEPDVTSTGEPTTLIVNFLQFVGAGWRTPADAMLANTSAAMAREHQETAREYLHTQAA